MIGNQFYFLDFSQILNSKPKESSNSFIFNN